MAKLMIELNDAAGGLVSIKWNPTVQEIINKHKSGHEITPAEGYFLSIATMIKEKSEIEAAKIRADKLEVFKRSSQRSINKHLNINDGCDLIELEVPRVFGWPRMETH